MTGLRVEGITVAYGRMPAVRDLTLHVDRGELVALLGRNGAGKTTTLRAIAGLQRTAGGRVLAGGVDITNRAPWVAARRGVAMVLPGARIFAQQTVAQNLELGMVASRDAAAAHRRRDAVLDVFPVLRARAGDGGDLLSGGERQQLAIAQALVAGPAVLLLDEPSVGLAPVIVARVMELCDALRRTEDAPAVLVAEQMVAPVLRVADRAVVIDGGRVVAEGTAAQLRDTPALVEAYLGRAPSVSG